MEYNSELQQILKRPISRSLVYTTHDAIIRDVIG